MARKTIHPVETLREHATALEAAMTVAMAEPRRPAVHKVRAEVRRMESQVKLLQQLAAMPEDSVEADEVQQQMRKLRRMAGQVRDLDVQRKILKTHPSLPKRAAAELREDLKETRGAKAKKLQRVLLKQLPRIAGAIEQMVQSVGTANGLVVPDLRLIPLIERWSRSTHEATAQPDQMDDEQLHTVRKTAKSARYMVENAAGSARARRAEERYEALQDAGGRWHDWLDLEASSREYFGKKHALTQAVRERCATARTEYVKLLEKTE